MADIVNTRRRFLGGAAIGAAVLGPLAFLLRARAPIEAEADGIVVLPGYAAPFRSDPRELAQWQALVGNTLRLTGTAGLVTAALLEVVEHAADPRPTALRQRGFTALWALDTGTTARDDLYRLDHPVLGATALFATAAGHRAGRPVLATVFN